MCELEKRLKNRNRDRFDQIELRLSKAREEISKYYIYDYVLINDNLDKCFEEINSIYEAEKLRRRMIDKEVSKLLEED